MEVGAKHIFIDNAFAIILTVIAFVKSDTAHLKEQLKSDINSLKGELTEAMDKRFDKIMDEMNRRFDKVDDNTKWRWSGIIVPVCTTIFTAAVAVFVAKFVG